MARSRNPNIGPTLRVRINRHTAAEIEKFRAKTKGNNHRWRFTTSDAVRLLIQRGLNASAPKP